VTIRLAGDAMFLVEFEEVIDPVINQRAIALAARLRARRIPGVHDVVPGYCSVGVHFDPLRTELAQLEDAIVADGRAAERVIAAEPTRVHEIPVVYGGIEGPDLEAVAEMSGCTTAEVVERHAASTYRVYMLGFVPGFAYLGRVDPRIAVPRHRVPRERVPAGSVGIAGEQTGVYPIESPGGWQLIGRTSTLMFDSRREPASLVAAGEAVRFVPQ
jgi:KipI family sensor histidine kinase inhibitor